MAAGALASVATILGFFGCFWWPFDLASHFRVQYLIGLFFLGIILALAKKRRVALMFGLFAVPNLVVVVPLYWGLDGSNEGTSRTIRAMSVNVNRALGNADTLIRVIREHDPDFIVMEEVSDEWLRKLETLEPTYPYRISQPREDNFGIALYSRLGLLNPEIVYLGEANVPSVVSRVKFERVTFHILGTHPLPPIGPRYASRRDEQLSLIPEYVAKLSDPVLLLGDLNTSPWSCQYRKLLAHSKLKDAARGRGIQPTWPTFIPLLLIPIDHCLYSEGININDMKIGANVGSDHYPIIVDFTISIDNSP